MNELNFPDPGEPPTVDWIDKGQLDVDMTYQRPEDRQRIDRMARTFSWAKFGAIVVVHKDGGRFNIVDGQHRAKAAILHPMVTVLPAVVLTGVASTAAEASSFLGLNGGKAVSPLQMHFAAVVAGDEDAMTIDQVCQRASVKLLRNPASNGDYGVGETIAIAGLKGLVSRRGVIRARQILEVLVQAKLAPITGNHIRAAELLLTDAEFCDEITAEDLTAAIERSDDIDDEVTAFAKTHRLPAWRALASIWFRRTRKKRKAA